MSTVLMVSAAAVFAAVCGALLKRGQKEIALLFSLAAAVLVKSARHRAHRAHNGGSL